MTSFYRRTNAFNVFNTMKNKSVIFEEMSYKHETEKLK